MPYCAKCGVEVDNDVKICPLCDYEIPKFDSEHHITNREDRTSFQPQNPYEGERGRKRRLAYIVSSAVILSATLNLFFAAWLYEETLDWAKYAIITLLAVWSMVTSFYVFKHSIQRLIISSTTICAIYFYLWDSFSTDLNYYFRIYLPVIVFTLLFVLFFIRLLQKLKTTGLNVLSFVFLGIVAYSLILNGLFSRNTYGEFIFTWSKVVAIALVPTAIVFMVIHYLMPKKYKEYFEMKLHL